MSSTIIIGGDAAGLSAASKLKRESPDHEVIVLERGEWVSYGACGLPYYVKGKIDNLEDLVVMEPEEFIEERDINLQTGTEATAIDTDERTVTAESNGETFELPYDNLVIPRLRRPGRSVTASRPNV